MMERLEQNAAKYTGILQPVIYGVVRYDFNCLHVNADADVPDDEPNVRECFV